MKSLESHSQAGLESFEVIAARTLEKSKHEVYRPLVRIEGRDIVIYDRPPGGQEHERYYLPLDQVQTALGVSFWFRQLSQKTWITTRHLYLLSCVIHSLHECD